MVDGHQLLHLGNVYSSSRSSTFLFTDASHFGCGAHLKQMRLSVHGHWREDKSQLRINILEMIAIHLALKKALQYIYHSCVMISTDNTTVVSYINKQGGTRSPNLCVEVCRILHWCLEYDNCDQSSSYSRQIQHIGRLSIEIRQASQNRMGFE